MDGILVFISLIVIIGLLVFVHELGHFLAAKFSGVVVEEFALGFGPSLFSKKYKGTLYSVKLFPLGGFVKMLGERDSGEENIEGSYSHKPLRSKLLILVAGVSMNVILACALFMIYLPTVNYQITVRKEGSFNFIDTASTRELPPSLFVLKIEPGSPAEGSLLAGDIITALDGNKVESDAQFRQFLADHAGKTIAIDVTSSEDFSQHLVNVKLRETNSEGKPLLGVGASYDTNSYYVVNYHHNILAGFGHAYNMFFYQIAALGSLVGQSFEKADIKPLASEVGGLVAVAGVVNDLISIKDFTSLINLTAVISLSLAFVNFLPIPLLDGGQATIEVIERIRGKKLSQRLMEWVNLISLIFIGLLFVAVTLKDIAQVGLVGNIISGIRDVLGR